MTYNESITILHIKHGASKDEIKKAYFKLAHIHHPDKGGEAKKFIEIKNAYDFLLVNDPPSTKNTSGFAYNSRWYNFTTGEYEDVPPTTGKTTTRSRAETYETSWVDSVTRKTAKQQEILVKKQKIAHMRSVLKQEEFQLSMLEFEMQNNRF